MSPRAISMAGTTPNAIAVSSASVIANSSIRPSRPTPASRGSSTGVAAISAFTDPIATATPSAVPITASSTLSVRNCRINRPLLAPIAARTATSRSRTVARASSRLATLVQVMISRNAAAPNSANSAGRKKPTTSVASGIARAV